MVPSLCKSLFLPSSLHLVRSSSLFFLSLYFNIVSLFVLPASFYIHFSSAFLAFLSQHVLSLQTTLMKPIQ